MDNYAARYSQGDIFLTLFLVEIVGNFWNLDTFEQVTQFKKQFIAGLLQMVLILDLPLKMDV